MDESVTGRHTEYASALVRIVATLAYLKVINSFHQRIDSYIFRLTHAQYKIIFAFLSIQYSLPSRVVMSKNTCYVKSSVPRGARVFIANSIYC